MEKNHFVAVGGLVTNNKALVDYCFEDLGAMKIVYSCRSENIASKKLQRSCGFHYTHSQPMVDKRKGLNYVLDFYELNRN